MWRRLRVHWSRRRWFHTARLCFWLIQIPFAVSIPAIRQSVPYLVALSLAALVESAATDVDQARAAEKVVDAIDGDADRSERADLVVKPPED